MGVKKLFTFLNNNSMYKVYPYMKDLLSDLKLNKSETIVGVDGNLYSYKYLHSYDNMLIGFYNQIINFLSNGIIPFYIFDGGTINEKESTNYYRYLKKINNKIKLDYLKENIEEQEEDYYFLKKKFEKNSLRITKEDINRLLELFDLLNIPYLFSHGEGEYLGVLLNKLGIIDMILTDDTDPIPAGAKKIIKFYNNNVYYLDTNYIYLKLDISHNELCDLCILMGNDYLSISHGFKINELLVLIKTYKNIEKLIELNFLTNLSIDKTEFIKKVDKIRLIYNNSAEYERIMYLEPTNNLGDNIIQFIDHTNYSNYSNVLLEFWDDLINIFKLNQINNPDSLRLKLKIIRYIKDKKFNIKNIIKFLKNYVDDISNNELHNTQTTFEYLNSFGF